MEQLEEDQHVAAFLNIARRVVFTDLISVITFLHTTLERCLLSCRHRNARIVEDVELHAHADMIRMRTAVLPESRVDTVSHGTVHQHPSRRKESP